MFLIPNSRRRNTWLKQNGQIYYLMSVGHVALELVIQYLSNATSTQFFFFLPSFTLPSSFIWLCPWLRTLHYHFQWKKRNYLFPLFMCKYMEFSWKTTSKLVPHNSLTKFRSQTSLKPIIVNGEGIAMFGWNKSGFASEPCGEGVKQNQAFLLSRQPIVLDPLSNIY